MDLLLDGLSHAFALILRGDPQVMEIMWLSLRCSGLATFLAILAGIPLGARLGLIRFRGRRLVLGVINAGMGLPPVAVGLFVSIFLWRSGPLGFLDLMYSPAAIVIAQVIIALPVVTGLTAAAVQQLDPRLLLQLRGLGASRRQATLQLLTEARYALFAAMMAAFGAVISEVGASMMVGGNLLHRTRVLTTATVLETGKGNFDIALALSILLVGLTFVVAMALTLLQQRERRP
ncbi:MAG: ABC transporter permease [Gemmatimonadota bacterium]|nr:ABC transporter permease [Gemmatimonadota bacterium]MDH5283423.1 ABC transporter permease [Gemmatimonadota bacterium]